MGDVGDGDLAVGAAGREGGEERAMEGDVFRVDAGAGAFTNGRLIGRQSDDVGGLEVPPAADCFCRRGLGEDDGLCARCGEGAEGGFVAVVGL